MTNGLATVLDRVHEILQRFPETRNDDRLLMLKYWNIHDNIAFDQTFPTTFAVRGTSPETLVRARRKIQETGEFLPTMDSVRERRRQREQQYRQGYAGIQVN